MASDPSDHGEQRPGIFPDCKTAFKTLGPIFAAGIPITLLLVFLGCHFFHFLF